MPGQYTLTPIAVALLAAADIKAPVLADDTTKEETAVQPGRTITPQDETRISAVAVKALRRIADARGKRQGNIPDRASIP